MRNAIELEFAHLICSVPNRRVVGVIAICIGIHIPAFGQATGATSMINQALSNSQIADGINAMRDQNQRVTDSIDHDTLAKVKAAMPQAAGAAKAVLNNGYVTVSPQGKDVISTIQALGSLAPKARMSAIKQLQNDSAQNIPEAVNFMGFVYEHGYFGAPKNINKAYAFYAQAAKANYQPAIFNLALISTYGKLNGARDLEDAKSLMAQAYSIGNESSWRVCGFATFLSLQTKDSASALRYQQDCHSPLSDMALAISATGMQLSRRIQLLRNAYAIGVDESLSIIESLAKQKQANDPSFYYCKYYLVKEYIHSKTWQNLPNDASACVEASYSQLASTKNLPSQTEISNAVVAFVHQETDMLARMRAANHFHYSWGVAFLPFQQTAVDMFTKLAEGEK